MSILPYDAQQEQRACTTCNENTCANDGCDKLFAIADCSKILNALNPDGSATANGYILPDDNIIDPNTWCQLNRVNSVTYNPNQTFHENYFLHSCVPDDEPGRKRPTWDLDIKYCHTDEGHCLLDDASINGCCIAFFCQERRQEFVPNLALSQLSAVKVGLARVQAPTISIVPGEQDTRTYTLRVVKHFWEFPKIPVAQNPLNRVEATGPAVNKSDDKKAA